MWVFRSGEDGLAPIILFKYTETCARLHAAKFLKGFQGYNNLQVLKGAAGPIRADISLMRFLKGKKRILVNQRYRA